MQPGTSQAGQQPSSTSSPPSASSLETVNNGKKEPTKLECPICWAELDVPKVLQCGHNLCQECETKSITKPGKKTSAAGGALLGLITCPLCKMVSEVRARGLPINYALKGKLLNRA